MIKIINNILFIVYFLISYTLTVERFYFCVFNCLISCIELIIVRYLDD